MKIDSPDLFLPMLNIRHEIFIQWMRGSDNEFHLTQEFFRIICLQ